MSRFDPDRGVDRFRLKPSTPFNSIGHSSSPNIGDVVASHPKLTIIAQ